MFKTIYWIQHTKKNRTRKTVKNLRNRIDVKLVNLNKLAYTGLCVLELSKVLMNEFHYDYIKNKHDNKLKLILTDTDNLMYEVKN